MTAKDAAALIDISAVRTHHTYSDIEDLVEKAKEYRFINVHVLPNWVSVLSEMLKNVEGVYVGAPVGFPSGAHATDVKMLEAKKLIQDGVEEMDIVMNIGRFKSKEYDYVEKELKEIISLSKSVNRKILVKVILEINTLTDDEMFRACEIVMGCKADFVKTGTGWIPGDANIKRIKKLKKCCGNNIKIKAAGGIRTREEFDELVDMGVERMGINTESAMEIVRSFHS